MSKSGNSVNRMVRVALAALLVAAPAGAYEFPVRDYSIREAYFLGRGKDARTAQFLSQYVRRFRVPKSGPHIAEIELRTPYQQVVLRARNAPNGYSSQRAREEYRASSDTLIVRVLIYLTPSYPAHSPVFPVQTQPVQLRPEDFWRDFGFGVYQKDEVQPRSITARPIYTSSDFALPGLIGSEVFLEFQASDFVEGPARVVVVAPTRQREGAQFDLSQLR